MECSGTLSANSQKGAKLTLSTQAHIFFERGSRSVGRKEEGRKKERKRETRNPYLLMRNEKGSRKNLVTIPPYLNRV